jgi:hypothetical protein
MMEGETPVLFPMNDEDGQIKVRRKPHRTHFVHAKSIKCVHPKNHHGSKKEAKEPVVAQIETAQRLLGASVAPLEKKKPNPPRMSVCRDQSSHCSDRMSIEECGFTKPFQDGFHILCETQCVHEGVACGVAVVSCAVHDGRKTHLSKDSGSIDHSVPIATPSVDKEDNPPGRSFRLHQPHLKGPPIDRRDPCVQDPAPIGRIFDRFSWDSLHQIGEAEGQKEVHDGTGEKKVEDCHLFNARG